MPTLDQIAREQDLKVDYKVELAAGGNLTQAVDSNGIPLFSTSDVGVTPAFPSSNVISGNNTHYNPTLDLYNNYCEVSEAGGSINIDLPIGFSGFFHPTELVIYFHPLLPISTSMFLQFAISGMYITFFSGAITGRKMVISTAGIPAGARHIRMSTMSGSPDGKNRVVAMELYNWSDETGNVVDTGNSGDLILSISSKTDDQQNAMPTPSDLQLTFRNIDGRYNSMNSSSPLYGILQPDGAGSGVRAGAQIRITAIGLDAKGNSFSMVKFKGFLGNDNNPGGSDGIQIDDLNGEALIVARSLLSKLTLTISPPVYEGASFGYIIQDVGNRCGIAIQDMTIQSMEQGVPYLAFNTQDGKSIIDELTKALPFMRVYESFDPDWKLVAQNFGRSRFDISWSRYVGDGFTSTQPFNANTWPSTSKNQLCVPSLKAMFVFGSKLAYTGPGTFFPPAHDALLWKWDMTQPNGLGVTQFGQDPYLNGVLGVVLASNGLVYLCDNNGVIKHFDPSASTMTLVSDGNLAVKVKCMVGFGNFVYVVFDTTVGFVTTSNLIVWDTTKAFSTHVNVGNLAHQVNDIRLIPGGPEVQPVSGVGVDGTFFFFRWSAASPANPSSTINIWKHNGTPYTTPYAGNNVDNDYFGALIIGGENYGNSCFAYNSNQDLFIPVAIKKVSGLFRQEIWKTNIATAYATPATLATKLGVVQDNTSAVFVQPPSTLGVTVELSAPRYGCCVNGTYIYFSDSENNAYVWDTSKNFSFLFQLAKNAYGAVNPILPSMQSLQAQVTANFINNYDSVLTVPMAVHVGPVVNGIDHLQRVWFEKINSNPGFLDPFSQFVGFAVQGAAQFNPNPSAVFDINDGFVVNMQISRGNPTANHVRLTSNLFVPNRSLTNLWTQSSSPMVFPSNQKTQLTIPLSGTSNRFDSGANAIIRRLFPFVHSQSTFVPDNPAITTVIAFNGHNYNVTFFAFSDIGFVTVDCTGLPAFVMTDTIVQGFSLNQNVGELSSIDVVDAVSKKMANNRDFLYAPTSPTINDLSFYQDILLNGKFSRTYLQNQETPWYPLLAAGQTISVQDSAQSMPPTLFEIVEYSIKGFKQTTLKAKQIYNTFII